MDGPVDPRQHLLNLVRGYRISQAIYVATRLGIPDLLADGPREIEALAHATGSHPPSLRRVLVFLAGVGVLDKVGPDRFALTPVAARLRTGVLERYPRLRGILFDQPHVIEDAQQILDEAGVGARCELVGGSFFDAVPAGADAYILRGIMPGFEDDQAVAILTNCRRAMAAGARVLLVERYLATDPHEALPVLISDLEMLVNVGGRERTTDEYATLLARGGFRLVQSISLGRLPEAMGYHLIEAQPV